MRISHAVAIIASAIGIGKAHAQQQTLILNKEPITQPDDGLTLGMFKAQPSPIAGAFFHRRQRKITHKFRGKRMRYGSR